MVLGSKQGLLCITTVCKNHAKEDNLFFKLLDEGLRKHHQLCRVILWLLTRNSLFILGQSWTLRCSDGNGQASQEDEGLFACRAALLHLHHLQLLCKGPAESDDFYTSLHKLIEVWRCWCCELQPALQHDTFGRPLKLTTLLVVNVFCNRCKLSWQCMKKLSWTYQSSASA